MIRAAIVVDLGFGDAGKGLVTDHLVRSLGAHTVVRFNGGAQAGHNVVAPDGRHHTFAQFGAGSFVPGVRTYLTRDVVVHPTALLVEAERLACVGEDRVLERIALSPGARVVTPWHQAACRLRELARGEGRHGSCGVGVGEVMRDAVRDEDGALRVRHFADPGVLRRRALEVRARLRHDVGELLALDAAEAAVFTHDAALENWLARVGELAARVAVVDDAAEGARLARAGGHVVFEGAQGVLLDEWRGFHPYTTWSTCTFDNACAWLDAHAPAHERVRMGVLRAYATRHGAGPLPTADGQLDAALPEPHNAHGPWQGAFRRGWPDLVLARYARAACGAIDALALTHLDALARLPAWQIARAYRVPAASDALVERDGEHATTLRASREYDLAHQARLTELLGVAAPVYQAIESASELAECVSGATGARVVLAAHGPRSRDVRAWGEGG